MIQWMVLAALATVFIVLSGSPCNLTTSHKLQNGKNKLHIRLQCSNISVSCNKNISNNKISVFRHLGISTVSDCRSIDDNCNKVFNLCENSREVCLESDNAGGRTTGEVNDVIPITCPKSMCEPCKNESNTTNWTKDDTTFTNEQKTTNELSTTEMIRTDLQTSTECTCECSTKEQLTDTNQKIQTFDTTDYIQPTIANAKCPVQNDMKVTVMGVLIGVLLILLLLVTTGWTWTYWVTKKRGVGIKCLQNNSSLMTSDTNNICQDNDTLKNLDNPIYDCNDLLEPLSDRAVMQADNGNVSVADYECVDLSLNESTGTITSVQNRKEGEAAFKREVKGEGNQVEHSAKHCTNYKDSSDERKNDTQKLDGISNGGVDAERQATTEYYPVLESHEENKTEESTEENVYHILEGPCDQDYEDVDDEECERVYHVLEGPTPKK